MSFSDKDKVQKLISQSKDNWGVSSEKSLSFANQAFNLATKIKDTQGKAQALRHIAVAYWYLDDYDQVLQKTEQALVLFKSINDKKGIAASLNTIATVQLNLERFEQAQVNYLEALVIAKEIDDFARQATVLQNLGTISIGLNKLDIALDFLNQSLALQQAIDDPLSLMTTQANIASVYRRKNELVKSLKILNQLIELAKENNSTVRLADAYSDKAHIFHLQGEMKKSVEFYKVAIEIAENSKLTRILVDSNKLLADVYIQLKQYQMAYQSLAQHVKYKEKVLIEMNEQALLQWEAKYKVEQQKKVIIEQDLRIAQQLSSLQLLISSIILLLLTTGFLYWGYRTKQIANLKLTQLSRVDPLTELLNRRAIHQSLNLSLQNFQRYQTPFSVILIDIDLFKNINDQYGHDCGDSVLKEISMLMDSQARSTDETARWGGEEFLILLNNTPIDEATIIAERLRGMVEQTQINCKNNCVKVTISLGVSAAKIDDDIDKIINQADVALYQCKDQGRNRVVSYDETT